MAVAHVIARAYRAIAEANRALEAAGRTVAKVPVADVNFVNRLAPAEVVTALREPGRQIVTLLHNRSVQLAADEAELDAVVDELTSSAGSKLWGAF